MSRTTVRLALQELENRGSIYRRHGKGTFVSDIKSTDLAGAYVYRTNERAGSKTTYPYIILRKIGSG